MWTVGPPGGAHRPGIYGRRLRTSLIEPLHRTNPYYDLHGSRRDNLRRSWGVAAPPLASTAPNIGYGFVAGTSLNKVKPLLVPSNEGEGPAPPPRYQRAVRSRPRIK